MVEASETGIRDFGRWRAVSLVDLVRAGHDRGSRGARVFGGGGGGRKFGSWGWDWRFIRGGTCERQESTLSHLANGSDSKECGRGGVRPCAVQEKGDVRGS